MIDTRLMNWTKLSEHHGEHIYSGSIIRVPTMTPYNGDWYSEAIVDFLVFDAFGLQEGAGLGLVVMSGAKAGKINAIFPASSNAPKTRALSKEWLFQNWKKYFYPEGEPHQAWIAEAQAVVELPDGSVWQIPAR